MQRCGPYTLLDRVGRGGMGVVYRATGPGGDEVAVKVLHDPMDSAARVRLEREVAALRAVDSPHVARVLDADVGGDHPYLVMEHVEGESLEKAVRRDGPLDELELVRLATALASALAAVHAAGVVHRDLKPSNVLLGATGPIIVDFGIAQLTDATRLTTSGSIVGTAGYAAPERYDDGRPGPASDVFAWGAAVAYAATGRAPFGSVSPEAVMRAVLEGRADLDGAPRSLLPLLRAALVREPARRPAATVLADRCARLERRVARRDRRHAVREEDPLELAGDTWPGRGVLLTLAALTVPGVIVTLAQPYAAFLVAAAGAVLVRAFWTGRWLARDLWWLALPLTVPGAIVWTAVWPGALAAGGAYVIAGLMSGFPVRAEALAPLDIAVAAVWFAVITGGVIGNEVERAGSRRPHLPVAAPRAFAVHGALVALAALLIRLLPVF